MHSKAYTLTMIIADVMIFSLIAMHSNRGAVSRHHTALTRAGVKSVVPFEVCHLRACSDCYCCGLANLFLLFCFGGFYKALMKKCLYLKFIYS